MALYGNDIDATTTPLEANLGWIVKLGKGDFIGRDVIERQAAEGVERRLVGFEMVDRGIARHGYDVYSGDSALTADRDASEPTGTVTSGTHSPTLGKAIGMAYVPPASADVGTELVVDIRGKRRRARVVELPFYSRKKKSTK
jgi:aminomethyltransferase